MKIDDISFEDAIYTEDKAEEDSLTAIPKLMGLNFHHVKRNLHLLEEWYSAKYFIRLFLFRYIFDICKH